MSELATLAPSPLKTLQEALKASSKSMSMVAASIVTPDKLIKIAIAAAQRNALLLQCTPSSIVRAVMQGAELGLVPGSALNHAYLVPFKNTDLNVYEAQLIISAQGLTELMYRSGLVAFVTSEVVYQGDEFEYELGLEPKLRHVPTDETIDSALITHAYMVVGLKDGSRVFRVMTRKGIDRIRAKSKSASKGPWVSDYAEMARKTVIKNGSKYVPKSIEVARAIALDTAQETGDWSGLDFDIEDSTPALEASSPTVDRVTEKVGEVGDPGEFALETPAGPEVLASYNLTSSEVKDLEKLAKSRGKNLYAVAASLEIKSLEGLQEALEA
jgi:recombination protein RecT